MKKNIVLFVLFILPIVAYLFFASGINGFTKLPILTPKISDLGDWKSLDNQKISLNDKITILGFSGSNLLKNRGNFFNLNQKNSSFWFFGIRHYSTFYGKLYKIICLICFVLQYESPLFYSFRFILRYRLYRLDSTTNQITISMFGPSLGCLGLNTEGCWQGGGRAPGVIALVKVAQD